MVCLLLLITQPKIHDFSFNAIDLYLWYVRSEWEKCISFHFFSFWFSFFLWPPHTFQTVLAQTRPSESMHYHFYQLFFPSTETWFGNVTQKSVLLARLRLSSVSFISVVCSFRLVGLRYYNIFHYYQLWECVCVCCLFVLRWQTFEQACDMFAHQVFISFKSHTHTHTFYFLFKSNLLHLIRHKMFISSCSPSTSFFLLLFWSCVRFHIILKLTTC